MNTNANGAVEAYRSVGTTGGITAADPHQLVLMLMNGALDALATAKGHITRRNAEDKGHQLARAIAIIEGLRASLDRSASADLTDNLDDLYEYMTRRILLANLRNETALVDEVADLMREVKSAWEAIPAELRHVSRDEMTAAVAV